MLLVPLFTATVLGALVIFLHYWQQRRHFRGAGTYRARFVQVVAQLGAMTESVNQMAAEINAKKDPKLLDYYEGTLGILETLLAAIRQVPPFGDDPGALDSALFLARDCRQRIGRLKQAFSDAAWGRPVSLAGLYTGNLAEPPGCYFCSRPSSPDRHIKVKVRIDGAVKDVASCRVCREELEATKKIKVLYFMKDGKQVHWSEHDDYSPSEDFWSINKRQAVQKLKHLELVPGHADSPHHE